MKMNEYTAYVLLTSLNLLIMNPILLTDFLFLFKGTYISIMFQILNPSITNEDL